MLELSSDDEFRAFSDAPEVLKLAIGCHGELEIALRVAIAEALADPHEIEIKRLSFPLKVDLAIALGAIRKSIRPLLLKLNQIRNDFAHNARAVFEDQHARELVGVVLEEHRIGLKEHFDSAKSPRAFLRICFVIGYLEARGSAEQVRKHKARKKEVLRETEKFLKEYDRKRREEREQGI